MRTVVFLVVLSVVAGTVVAGGEDPLLGVWATDPDAENGQAHVEIVRTGDGYEGRIVWLELPRYPEDDDRGMGGQLRVDRENPDPDLRSRPIQGLVLLEGFVRSGKTAWKDGTIYDPNNGKTYRCKMELKGTTLKVRGFIGFSLLGRTAKWTRVVEKEGGVGDP